MFLGGELCEVSPTPRTLSKEYKDLQSEKKKKIKKEDKDSEIEEDSQSDEESDSLLTWQLTGKTEVTKPLTYQIGNHFGYLR